MLWLNHLLSLLPCPPASFPALTFVWEEKQSQPNWTPWGFPSSTGTGGRERTRPVCRAHITGHSPQEELLQPGKFRESTEKRKKEVLWRTASPQQTYIPRYDQLRSAASSPTDLRRGNFGNCGKERQRCLHGAETREHTTSPSGSEFNPHSYSFWGRRGSTGVPQCWPTFIPPWARLGFPWAPGEPQQLTGYTTPAVFRNS